MADTCRLAAAFALGAAVTYYLTRPKPRPSDGPAVSATLALLEGGTVEFNLPLVGVIGAKFIARFTNADGRVKPIFSPEAFLTDTSLGTVTMELQTDNSYLVTLLHAETAGTCDIIIKGKPISDSENVIQATGTINFVDAEASVVAVDFAAGVLIPE